MCIFSSYVEHPNDIFKNMVVYGCEHCTGAGETCIGSRVAEARAAWQKAWLVQLVTSLITYLQAFPAWKTIESFTSLLQAVGCGLAAAQQNPTLIYVGDLAHVANIKTLNSRIRSTRLANNKICVSFVHEKQCVYVFQSYTVYYYENCKILAFLHPFLFAMDWQWQHSPDNKSVLLCFI